MHLLACAWIDAAAGLKSPACEQAGRVWLDRVAFDTLHSICSGLPAGPE
jgi:hypothetical protein